MQYHDSRSNGGSLPLTYHLAMHINDEVNISIEGSIAGNLRFLLFWKQTSNIDIWFILDFFDAWLDGLRMPGNILVMASFPQENL